jgi:hypothetical protein
MERNPYETPVDVSGELPKPAATPGAWIHRPFHPYTLLAVIATLGLLVLWLALRAFVIG